MSACVVLPPDLNPDGTVQMLKGEHTRGLIMDAAYSLFANQGYAATSMRQIAEEAGLALGGIYNHFSSKEAIFQAALNERQPWQYISPLFISGNVDRMAAQTYLDELDHHPEIFNLLLVEMLEFKGRHLAELFESVLPDMPAPLAWRAFLSMVVAYQITRLLLVSTMPPGTRQISPDVFIDLFLNGVLKSE